MYTIYTLYTTANVAAVLPAPWAAAAARGRQRDVGAYKAGPCIRRATSLAIPQSNKKGDSLMKRKPTPLLKRLRILWNDLRPHRVWEALRGTIDPGELNYQPDPALLDERLRGWFTRNSFTRKGVG